MTSNRQIEANRMNTKRSTGPKTAAGKERASGNALRHGQTGDKRGLFSFRRFWVAAEAPHPSTGKISRPADDVGHDDGNRLPNGLLHPDEKLRDAVDLIVIGAIRL